MTLKSLNRRAEAVGYRVHRHVRSGLNGRTYPYAVLPTRGGTPSFHEDKDGAIRRIEWVETVRSWQND